MRAPALDRRAPGRHTALIVTFLLRPLLHQRRGFALGLLALSVGCGDALPLDANLGPFVYEVDLARITLPEPWRSGTTLAALSCQSPAQCPTLGPGAPALRCTAGLCDPDPFPFDLSMPEAIDLSTSVPGLESLGGSLQSVTITTVRYAGRSASASVAVGPTDLYWGPESASGIGSDGVRLLARVPVLRVDRTGALDGTVSPNPDGAAALSQHLTRTSRRFRIFARAAVDLTPRGALPAGRASVSVQLSVRVTGQLLP